MPETTSYDGNYWRKRAKLTLEKANSYEDEAMQLRLAYVAGEYEKLALRADAMQHELGSPPTETR